MSEISSLIRNRGIENYEHIAKPHASNHQECSTLGDLTIYQICVHMPLGLRYGSYNKKHKWQWDLLVTRV